MAECDMPDCGQPINNVGQHNSPIQYAHHRVAQDKQEIRHLKQRLAEWEKRLVFDEEDLSALLHDHTGSYV